MTTYVGSNTSQYPYLTVVHLITHFTDGGASGSGSGVVIGQNDILTASHCVYERGRSVDYIEIIPGQDGSTKPVGTYQMRYVNYNVADSNADGYFTTTESSYDFAVIATSERIAGVTGWMGWSSMQSNVSTYATVTGYPGVYGSDRMSTDAGYVSYDSSQRVINISEVDINPGNSGGPIWDGNTSNPHVYGVVSTRSSAASFAANAPVITGWVEDNDAYIAVNVADDYASDIRTTGLIHVGSSVTGNIEIPSDTDWVAITLQAGQSYRIDLRGATSNSGTASDPSIVGIYNANGSIIQGTSNDDIAYGVDNDSRVDYNCTLTGQYYISAAAYGTSTGTYTLSVSDITPATTSAENIDIYRFFNRTSGQHFFTASTAERDSVLANIPQYDYEGTAFRGAPTGASTASDVYRFNNLASGEHFYTISMVERDSIRENLPLFRYENVAYLAHETQVTGTRPLYRFLTDAGTHFYTADQGEKDSIIANLPSYHFEGTAYWVY